MKFKKHINFLLALLILVSNTGLAFNVHYCEGNISGISFSYQQEETCVEEELIQTKIEKSCCAQTTTHDACCENSKVEIKKNTTENVLIKTFQLNIAPFIQTNEWKSFFVGYIDVKLHKNDTPEYYCDTNAPPYYKLYSQYIFYDSIIS